MTSKTKWVVTCPEFVSGPVATQEAAQKRLERIEAQGACRGPHQVQEATPELLRRAR